MQEPKRQWTESVLKKRGPKSSTTVLETDNVKVRDYLKLQLENFGVLIIESWGVLTFSDTVS